ncbi:putative oxidoreductase [Escherichia coli]|nr:putative oxidoreductase [Escherichia coli]
MASAKSTTRYHLPYVLNRKDSWHVAHIFRRHAKPEEQAPIYSHIHFTSDLDEVLNDPDVKLVVVCTHADSHFEYAKRALEAGKNVLVEKPFTPTLAQAKELFALAKSKGLTVTPYQNRRFDSCFLTAKKAIESGKLERLSKWKAILTITARSQKPNLGCRRMARSMALVCIRWTRLFLCSVARITSAYDIRSLRNKPILTILSKRNCFMAI